MCLARRGWAIVASTPGGRLKRVANGRQKIYFKLKKKLIISDRMLGVPTNRQILVTGAERQTVRSTEHHNCVRRKFLVKIDTTFQKALQ